MISLFTLLMVACFSINAQPPEIVPVSEHETFLYDAETVSGFYVIDLDADTFSNFSNFSEQQSGYTYAIAEKNVFVVNRTTEIESVFAPPQSGSITVFELAILDEDRADSKTEVFIKNKNRLSTHTNCECECSLSNHVGK